MKIEIELVEVERLRDDVLSQKKEIDELETKLRSLDEAVLKKKAVSLSKWLFDNYMECVFKGLGFDQKIHWERSSVNFPDSIEHYLGKDWWNNKRVTVEVSANVSAAFKRAFLDIGFNPDIKKEEETLDWVPEPQQVNTNTLT